MAAANKYDFETRDLTLQHLQKKTTYVAYVRDNAMLQERKELVDRYEEYAFSMITSIKVVQFKGQPSK